MRTQLLSTRIFCDKRGSFKPYCLRIYSGMSSIDKTIKRILGTRYTLPNGKLIKIFVQNMDRYGDYYDCLLCSVQHMGKQNLVEHARGRKHISTSATMNCEDRRRRPTPNTNFDNFIAWSRQRKSELARNEDTPLHKSERKTSKLQSVIDEVKDVSIVGLEYILDVQSNMESSYHCVLCQQVFDRISDVVEHLTSYNHRLMYLKKFFPKVFDEVLYLIEIVCAGIESQYSRFNLIVLERNEFLENRDKFTRLGSNSKYINKNIGCAELTQTVAAEPIRAGRNGTAAPVEAISISSDTSSEFDYTSQELCNKLESYRIQMTRAKNEVLNKYQLFITNPCSYPTYYKLWVTFWNLRISELRNGNKFNTSYEWTAEWASEWKKIMNEKMKIELEAKSCEITKQLQIKDSMLTEVEKNLIKIPEIVVDIVKPAASKSTQQPVQPIPLSFRNSNSDRTISKSAEQKTSSVCSAPLGLEQLLQKHKHSGDFLISWRELLNIFGIEDNSNSNEIEHVPITPQTNHDANDFSEKQMDRIDASKEIVAFEAPQVNHEPDEFLEKRMDRVDVSSETVTFEAPQTNQEPNDFSEQQMDLVDVSAETAAIEDYPVETVEQVTVISVLSLLLALENILGRLASKVIHLLQTAIAMERLKADSSYSLLNQNSNCILLETIKEKFKGLLAADLVAENVQAVVQKAIDDMTYLIQQSNETANNSYVPPLFSRNVEETQTFDYVESSPVEIAIEEPTKSSYEPPPFKRNVEETPTKSQTFVYMESSLPETAIEYENNENIDETVTLRDSEIKILMTKFTLLSEEDKSNFTAYLNKLRISDPNRLARLKNDICEIQPLNQTSFLEWERDINYPNEAFYSDSTSYTKNATGNGDYYKTTSIAYQVAQKNAGVKIKRRINGEGDGFLSEKRFCQG